MSLRTHGEAMVEKGRITLSNGGGSTRRHGIFTVLARFWVVSKIAVLCASMVSCVDNDTSIFIREVVRLDPSTCKYSVNASSGETVGRAILDLAFLKTYEAGVVVGSQLVSRGQSREMTSESARFRITEAVIQVEGTQGKETKVPVTGFVDPSSGSTPSYSVVAVPLIDRETAERISGKFVQNERNEHREQLVSVIRIKGQTLGGRKISTGEYRVPIEVCYGCLVAFPADAVDETQPIPNCAKRQESATVTEPCRIGQDDAVDCRVCQMRGVPLAVCLP